MITITDFVGCSSIATITLTDPPAIIVNPSGSTIPCDQVCTGTVASNASGGTQPLTYHWNNGQLNDSLTNLCAGNYQVTVTDNHGCKKTSSTAVTVQSTFTGVQVEMFRDTIFKGQSTQITVTNLPNCTYQWSPVSGLSNAGISNPMANPLTSTIYFFTITDQFGCQYKDSLKIHVIEVNCRDPYIYVPNAFTPNHDNLNDELLVYGNAIENLKLSVYDRWGEEVFETTNQSKGWDGTFRGKLCDPGVFVYQLEATCFDKTVYKTKGNITLIR